MTAKDLIKPTGSNFPKDIVSIEEMIRMGEEPYEIEHTITRNAKEAMNFFGVWLIAKGKEQEAGILPQMIPYFFEFIYLIKWSRRASLAEVTKPVLQEYFKDIEFSVSEQEWDQGLNPFDGILLFYQFLEESGYEAKLERRKRAIKEIRKKMKKTPMPSAKIH